MRHLPLAWLFALAGSVYAQDATPSVVPETPAAPPAASAVTPADSKPSARRMLSPDTAAKLSAAVPKFTGPAPEAAPAEPPVTSPLLRDADKPRNQIIRLPRFVVEEPKPRVSKELQVLTPKGRVDLGFKRHPGLRMVPFAALNAPVARALLEDELESERRREEADLWSLYAIREPATVQAASLERTGAR